MERDKNHALVLHQHLKNSISAHIMFPEICSVVVFFVILLKNKQICRKPAQRKKAGADEPLWDWGTCPAQQGAMPSPRRRPG